MHRGTPGRLFIQAAVLSAAPILIGASGLTSDFNDRVLASQNRERASMGVPPLKWNTRLQGSAQLWANELAQTSSFRHAVESTSNPQGENLWQGTKDSYSAEEMVGGWIRERSFYKSGVFPNNSTTGNFADVAHYTQLMWRQTQSVGCAIASSSTKDIVVCRYSAAGNYVGDIPF